MEFQPTDEITIVAEFIGFANHAICNSQKVLNVEPPVAGHADQLMFRIWSCLGRYDKATGLQLLRKRTFNEDSATTRSFRPDLLVSYLGALLFKGKDKTDSSHMNAAAMSALTEELKRQQLCLAR